MKPQVDILDLLTTADWLVFTLALLFTFLVIVYGNSLKKSKQENSALELLLMGRRLTLPLFVGTLVATWYGGIFGVTQIAFEKGLFNWVTQGFFWYLTYLIFAFFMVKRIRKFEAYTLPDLVGKMFGPRSQKMAGVLNFFNVVPVVYVISVGLFIQLFSGFDLALSMLLGVMAVTAYSFFGGFRAVVFSDLVQFFIMCLSVFFVLVFSLEKFGGFAFLQENLPPQHLTLTGGESWGTLIAWGLIALSTLVDPNFYQRCFAAKNTQVAKRGILISTCIWFCFDICTTFGALYARSTIPHAAPEQAYLIYSIQVLPAGFRGLFLAGILATILSTIDSYIFLAGTTLTFDLLPKKFRSLKWLHQLGILAVACLAFILAYYFEGNIKMVWKTLGSYSAACLLLPVLFGHLFPGRLRDNQFVLTCLISIVTTTLWRHSAFKAHWDELYAGALTCFILLVYFSLKSDPVHRSKGQP